MFLAEVTDDLEQRRDNMKRYLAQAGINVLPNRTYRLVREDFERSCLNDLEKCSAFVQLLGPFAGKRLPDVPDGFGWLQLELAKRQKALPVLQWRDPALDPASVDIPLQRALLEGEHVQAVPFEDFKRSVVTTVKRKATPPPAQPATESEASLVFINADAADAADAEMIQNALGNRFGLLTPLRLCQLDAKSAAIKENEKFNMVSFDALVILYGGAPPDWVASQQRLYLRLKPGRAKQKKSLIFLAEGPPKPKAPLPIRLPGMITVPIDKVVDALNAAFPL